MLFVALHDSNRREISGNHRAVWGLKPDPHPTPRPDHSQPGEHLNQWGPQTGNMGLIENLGLSGDAETRQLAREIEKVADGEINFDPGIIASFSVRVYTQQTQGKAVDQWKEIPEPVSKEEFKEYAEAENLQRGKYNLLAIDGNQRVRGRVWSVEAGVDQPEEIDPVEDRLRRIEEQVTDGTPPGDVRERVLDLALNGELEHIDDRTLRNAERLADVMQKFDSDQRDEGIFGHIENKKDWGEVGAAVGLSLIDEPDKFRELIRNGVQGIREGIEGPPPPPGQEPEAEPEPEPTGEREREPPARGRKPTVQEKAEALMAEAEDSEAEPEGETEDIEDRERPGEVDVSVPENATELDELTYNEKANLAVDMDYDGNPWSTPHPDLREWLHSELFGHLSEDTDEDDENPAETDESEPETHSGVRASPDVSDVIEGDSTDVAADGGDDE